MAQALGGIFTRSIAFDWYDNGLREQYESGMSVRRFETFTVPSNGGASKELDHLLWRAHEGENERGRNRRRILIRTRPNLKISHRAVG